MDTIVTRAPNSPHRSWRIIVVAAAVGVAVIVAFFAVNGLVSDPAVVSRITIRNETSDLVEVLARGDAGGDLVPVVVVEPDRNATAYDVVDQGDRWTFIVRVTGDTITKLRFTRDELEQADWTVVVPNSAPGTSG